MHRLLLFLSLLPLLAALVLRKLKADRILKLSRDRGLSGDGAALAKRMLSSMGHENTELQIKKRGDAVLLELV